MLSATSLFKIPGSLKDKIDEEDSQTVKDAMEDGQSWMDSNPEADAEDIKEKHKEVEGESCFLQFLSFFYSFTFTLFTLSERLRHFLEFDFTKSRSFQYLKIQPPLLQASALRSSRSTTVARAAPAPVATTMMTTKLTTNSKQFTTACSSNDSKI